MRISMIARYAIKVARARKELSTSANANERQDASLMMTLPVYICRHTPYSTESFQRCWRDD